jgi:hypothetical protein
MSNIHTPSSHIKKAGGQYLAITAATTNSAGIDCLGFENALAIFGATPSGAGTTADCKLQESSDGATGWADVPNGNFTQITTAGGAQTYIIDVVLAKRLRYLRFAFTGAGGAAAGIATMAMDLVNGRFTPVTQLNTPKSI